MNCVVCNIFLQEENFHIDIFYNVTTHTNSLLIDLIKKILNWDLHQCNLRYLCQLCYNLIEELDFAELTCSNIKKQLKERGEIHKYNICFKDSCTQTCDDENLEILSNSLLDSIKTETSLVDFRPEFEKEAEKDDKSLKIIKPYECIFCQKKFTSKSGLNLHTQKQHKNNNEETVQDISIQEDSSIKLEVDYEQDDNFKSDTLSDLSDSNEADDENLTTKKLKKPKEKNMSLIKPLKYPCPQCPKMWRTLGELKNHVATHSTIRPYICEICGQAYKHKQALDVHIGMHNGINPFCCQYCNKAFTQKGALRRHLPIHTGEAPYQCDLCGKRFVHHTSFNMHTLAHTGQKSYKCDVCGLALLSGSHLKRHMRVHTGERPFACTQCGKRFAERYNLAAHQRLHEAGPSEVTKQRLFRCQVCGLGFERRTKLEEHLSNSHNKISENENERKWINHFVATCSN